MIGRDEEEEESVRSYETFINSSLTSILLSGEGLVDSATFSSTRFQSSAQKISDIRFVGSYNPLEYPSGKLKAVAAEV